MAVKIKAKKKSFYDKELAMDIGKKEEEVYSETGREKLVDDDEIAPWEEGFMEGAEERGELAKCAYCGKVLGEENIVEKRVKGEIYLFCSENHAEKGKKKARID